MMEDGRPRPSTASRAINLRVERKYEYRRKLPHYQPDFMSFFITFSTHERWILPEDARSLVLQTCLQGNGKNFRLHAGVVMPDHVHLILTPFYDADGPISLMEILQAIKGASAHRINRLLQRRGPVWESESFDRALRREENIDAKIDYLIGNPRLVRGWYAIPWTTGGSGEKRANQRCRFCVSRGAGGDARPPSRSSSDVSGELRAILPHKS